MTANSVGTTGNNRRITTNNHPTTPISLLTNAIVRPARTNNHLITTISRLLASISPLRTTIVRRITSNTRPLTTNSRLTTTIISIGQSKSFDTAVQTIGHHPGHTTA